MSADACANPMALGSGDLIGLTVTSEAALLSGVAILVVVGLILHKGRTVPVFKTHVDIYMVSLLASDMLQALGAAMDIRWIRKGHIACGGYCTAQGAIQTLGEPGVAMVTVVIAVHTFLVLFFRWTPPRSFLAPLVIVGAIWLYVALYAAIAYTRHHAPGAQYFVPTPYWCWVSARYADERLTEEYLWLWSAALLSLALYIPLFFAIRGNIVVDPGRTCLRKISFRRRRDVARRGAFSPSRQSMKMLLYPACYVLTVAPVTLARWIAFSGNAIAPAWIFLAASIYYLSGFTNVLLLTLTRPSILSFGTEHTTQHAVVRSALRDRPSHNDIDVNTMHVEDDDESDGLSSKRPSMTRPSGAAVPGLRTPDAAYQLQDMRDRESRS